MRYFFLILSAVALFAMAFKPLKTSTLSGKVIDDTNAPLIGVNINVQKDGVNVAGASTNIEGDYTIKIEQGTYDVTFSYTGYETVVIKGVTVGHSDVTRLDQMLKPSGVALTEVVVTAAPLSTKKAVSSSSTIVTREDLKSVRKEKGRSKAKKADAVSVKGSRSTATDYYTDGIRVEKPAKEIEESAPSALEDDASDAPGGGPDQPSPKAGLLTGGEWNDLHNWNKHWTDLISDGEIEAYENQYGFFPKNRYTVLLQNQDDLPLVDAVVRLADEAGKTIWEARTDNMGRAELWAGMFDKDAAPGKLNFLAEVDGNRYRLGKAKPYAEGVNTFRINRPCSAPNLVDVLWVVDATGSMGDEIEYLKSELLDVMGRVKGQNPTLTYRMGSVFYRDEGDAYIAKSSLLNADISKTVDYIRLQHADGGGDYPEAVHTALEEAIYRQPWSKNAAARILFLVLDASPHDKPEVAASLQKSIREAARLGIRIVPVAASGIQKDTEFLMKFFGLATNGTYTFLTDHSGIGGKHLEPTTDEYKVEAVNDLLVRIISEYSSVESCDGKSTIRSEENPDNDPQQQQLQAAWQALYYPNPANSQVFFDLPDGVTSITIYNAEGVAVRKHEKPAPGLFTVEVNDLPEGFYTIRILKDGQLKSGKLMVMHGL